MGGREAYEKIFRPPARARLRSQSQRKSDNSETRLSVSSLRGAAHHSCSAAAVPVFLQRIVHCVEAVDVDWPRRYGSPPPPGLVAKTRCQDPASERCQVPSAGRKWSLSIGVLGPVARGGKVGVPLAVCVCVLCVYVPAGFSLWATCLSLGSKAHRVPSRGRVRRLRWAFYFGTANVAGRATGGGWWSRDDDHGNA